MHYHSILEYCMHSFVFYLLNEIFELKSSEFVDKEGIIERGVMKRLVLTREEEKKGTFLFVRIVLIRSWCYEPHAGFRFWLEGIGEKNLNLS